MASYASRTEKAQMLRSARSKKAAETRRAQLHFDANLKKWAYAQAMRRGNEKIVEARNQDEGGHIAFNQVSASASREEKICEMINWLVRNAEEFTIRKEGGAVDLSANFGMDRPSRIE